MHKLVRMAKRETLGLTCTKYKELMSWVDIIEDVLFWTIAENSYVNPKQIYCCFENASSFAKNWSVCMQHHKTKSQDLNVGSDAFLIVTSIIPMSINHSFDWQIFRIFYSIAFSTVNLEMHRLVTLYINYFHNLAL